MSSGFGLREVTLTFGVRYLEGEWVEEWWEVWEGEELRLSGQRLEGARVQEVCQGKELRAARRAGDGAAMSLVSRVLKKQEEVGSKSTRKDGGC